MSSPAQGRWAIGRFADGGRDELAQRVLGFGRRLVVRRAVGGAPPEIRECNDVPSVLVAFDLGGMVVGIVWIAGSGRANE